MSILWVGTSIADIVSTGLVTLTSATGASSMGPTVKESINCGGSGRFQVDLPAKIQELWFTGYYYTAANALTGFPEIALFDKAYSATQPLYQMVINANTSPYSLKWQAWNGTAMVDLAAFAGASPGSGTVQRIDVRLKRGDTDGEARVYVNGMLQFTFSGKTSWTGIGSGIDMMMMAGGRSSSHGGNWSQMIAADEDTRSLELAHVKPNAAGGNAGWSGLFSDVNAVGIDDNTRIVATALNQITTFQTQALPAGYNSGYDVVAMIVGARGRKGVTTDHKVRSATRVSGTSYELADFSLATGFGSSQTINTLSPATGLPWTYTEVGAAEIGVKTVAP